VHCVNLNVNVLIMIQMLTLLDVSSLKYYAADKHEYFTQTHFTDSRSINYGVYIECVSSFRHEMSRDRTINH